MEGLELWLMRNSPLLMKALVISLQKASDELFESWLHSSRNTANPSLAVIRYNLIDRLGDLYINGGYERCRASFNKACQLRFDPFEAAHVGLLSAMIRLDTLNDASDEAFDLMVAAVDELERLQHLHSTHRSVEPKRGAIP